MVRESVRRKPNQSFVFLLPLFNIRNTNVIVNTYLGNSKTAFDNKLYVLTEVRSDEIENNIYLIDKYKTENGMFMYELKIPEHFENDYRHFLNGKYSKFSEKAKDAIITKIARSSAKASKDTIIYSILYKTEKRRKQLEKDLDVKLPADAELASIFNPDLELYGND